MPKPENATEAQEPLDPIPTSMIADALSTPSSSAAKAQAVIRQLLRAIDPDNPDHLHHLLDIILTLRRIARGDSDGEAAVLGREAAAVLIHGALGWTRPTRPTYAPSIEALEAEPARWRFEVSAHLSQGTDLLPDWLSKPLHDALDALRDGSGLAPFLLAPTPKQGHGLNPGYARFLERKMVCWMFFEAGRGATMEQATKIVADAAGRTVKAVEAWRTDWAKENAAELAADEAKYRARGAGGQPFDDLGGTPDEIVRDWRQARLPAKARS